jgi:hypothetical protein
MLQVLDTPFPYKFQKVLFLKSLIVELKLAYMKLEVRGTTANVNPLQRLSRVSC